MMDLGRFGKNNPGGGLALQFAPVGAVANFSSVSGGRYFAPVSFLEGWRWFGIYGRPQSIFLEEQDRQTTAGVHYDAKVGLFVPGDMQEYRRFWSWAADKKFMVLVKEQTGERKLVGSVKEGLTVRVEYNSGTGMGDERGFVVAFEGKTTEMAGFYVF